VGGKSGIVCIDMICRRSYSRERTIENFLGVVQLFLVLGFLTSFLALPQWTMAQQEERPGYQESVEDKAPYLPATAEMAVGTFFNVQSFEQDTLGTSGIAYSLGISGTVPGHLKLFLDIPVLWGDREGAPAHEIGNPKGGINFRIAQFGYVDWWAETWASLSQQGAIIANRHDTYRIGTSLKAISGKFSNSVGFGYRIRNNEQDPQVDVGDEEDFNISSAYHLVGSWTLLASLDWLRSNGVTGYGVVYARAADLVGVSPGLKYRLSQGLELSTTVTFPVLLSRSAEETEISLWDWDSPQVSAVTWRTQVGVSF